MIDEASTSGATVHFESLMDICHLKNAELEAKHQKYKGRVVLRGDIVKDNSGSYAVFTEQGSSASQMTAAKIMDITVFVLYFVPPLSFQPFQMFTSVFNERFESNPLCDFRLGTVATSDHETPLTGYEPKQDSNLVNTEELDLAATSDVYWQHTLDDDASLNDPDVDDNQLAKYLAVVVDRTGQPVEVRSNSDNFSCDVRNLKSAQNQFLLVTQPEIICQTGGVCSSKDR